MKIGIDIDDTLTCTFEYVKPLIKDYIENELYKEYKYYESEKEWYYLTDHYGLSEEEQEHCWDNFYKSENYLPMENAVEIINKLSDEKNEIIFITHRNKDNVNDGEQKTKEWLQNHNIKYNKLFMSVEDKGKLAQKENVDVFIDDSIRHCKSVSDKGIKTFLITREYNKFYECNEFERVDSWNDFYNKINNK